MEDDSFVTAQVLADLRAVAEPAWRFAPALQVTGVNGIMLRAAPPPEGPDPLDKGEAEAKWTAVSAPRKDDEGLAASAILLGRAIRDRADWVNLRGLWDRTLEAVRAADTPVRAAIMNGFKRADALGLCDGLRPSPEDCTTNPREAVIAALVPVARGMSNEERVSVASSSYPEETERHRASLEKVLARPGRRLGSDETWFPSEAIELCADDPCQMGGAGAMAILLLTEIQQIDCPEYNLPWRWRDCRDAVCALPEPTCRAILSGVRHLYETTDCFDDEIEDLPAIPWRPANHQRRA